jgi:hypothetical protein
MSNANRIYRLMTKPLGCVDLVGARGGEARR